MVSTPGFHWDREGIALGIVRRIGAVFLLLVVSACMPGAGEQADASVEAPACARPRRIDDGSYLVFFDRNSASLTPRAQNILGELAARWRRNGGRFLELNGHADAQEARTARPSLALERADAVKSYLVAQGINPQRIMTEGFGKDRPLVEADRAEPQNRRVEPVASSITIDDDREAYLDRLLCRIWVRDHCITPTRLAHAGAAACNAALSAS